MEQLMKKAFDHIYSVDIKFIATVCGSFRRGKHTHTHVKNSLFGNTTSICTNN